MRLLLFVFSICLSLVGCADFADTPGKSVWSEGLWILPWVTGLGSLYFFYTAYVASKSNSTIRNEKGVFDNTGNVAIYKIGRFWFGVALAIATIVIIIAVVGSK